MTLYLEALVAIALSLSFLMAGAWMVQQRTGNSGWVDTIWTFSLGLVLPRHRRDVRLRRRQRMGRQPLPDEGGIIVVIAGFDPAIHHFEKCFS